jgi:hypothetical protein
MKCESCGLVKVLIVSIFGTGLLILRALAECPDIGTVVSTQMSPLYWKNNSLTVARTFERKSFSASGDFLCDGFSSASPIQTTITCDDATTSWARLWCERELNVLIGMFPQNWTLDRVQEWWLTNSCCFNPLMPSTRSGNLTLQFHVVGGGLDSHVFGLSTSFAVYPGLDYTYSPTPDVDAHSFLEALVLTFEWGTAPSNYVSYINQGFYRGITGPPEATTEMLGTGVARLVGILVYEPSFITEIPYGCISIDDAERTIFGGRTAQEFCDNLISNLLHQVESNDAFLQGITPEYLTLYDCSGFQIDSFGRKVIGISPTNFAYVNQYDGGEAYNLPGNGYNACGPSCVAMAIQYYGGSDTLADTYYSTMCPDGFLWPKAASWLRGEGTYEGVPFPSVINTPLPTAFFSENISFQTIDQYLYARLPVIIHTDLSVGTGKGSGHLIELLGIGRNDYIGDYYIVADPAGHYFANQGGLHYGGVSLLQNACLGMNHGGWFAMYPKAEFQTRMVSHLHGRSTRRALLPRSPVRSCFVEARSPVDLLVLAPNAAKCGIVSNGPVLEQILGSSYQMAVADDEVAGTTTEYQTGPNSVVILNPFPGVFDVNLVGTSNSVFSLQWLESQATGAIANSETREGVATLGVSLDYLFTNSQVAPLLTIAPTNGSVLLNLYGYPGRQYRLEVSTALAAWTPLATNFSPNGFSVFSDPVRLSVSRFYRGVLLP